MRRALVLVIVAPLLCAVASPAWAAEPPQRVRARVVLTGGLELAKGERANTVVVFHGTVRIDGDVEGSVVVFDGAFFLSGTVRDNVVVFNGRVVLRPGARVGGDLITRLKPTIQSGATVGGEIKRLHNLSWSLSQAWRWALWVAYSISTLILGMIVLGAARRSMEGAAAAARTKIGPSIGWGLLLFFGLPLAGILLLLTVVGIPLGIALLLALWLLYTIGYTTTLFAVGRMVLREPRSRFVAFLAGWGIMRVLAIVPFLGGVLWFAGAVFGLGAMVAAANAARRVPSEGAVPPPPPVPATSA
jgi:hypothetical protein